MNNRKLYPKNWQTLRLLIILRDEFRCTICGIQQYNIRSKSGKKMSLSVMHLDGNTFNNEYVLIPPWFNNPLNNLASACPSCHRIFDQQNGNISAFKKRENHTIVDLSNMAGLIGRN